MYLQDVSTVELMQLQRQAEYEMSKRHLKPDSLVCIHRLGTHPDDWGVSLWGDGQWLMWWFAEGELYLAAPEGIDVSGRTKSLSTYIDYMDSRDEDFLDVKNWRAGTALVSWNPQVHQMRFPTADARVLGDDDIPFEAAGDEFPLGEAEMAEEESE